MKIKLDIEEAYALYKTGLSVNEVCRVLNKKYGLVRETGWYSEKPVRNAFMKMDGYRGLSEARVLSVQNKVFSGKIKGSK